MTGELFHRIPIEEFTHSQNIIWSKDGESLIFSDGQSFPTITPLILEDTTSD